MLTVRHIGTQEQIQGKKIFPSPCIRRSRPALDLRSTFPKELFVRGMAVPVVSLPASVEIPEEPPEALEERQARRQMQTALLSKARAAQLGSLGTQVLGSEHEMLSLFTRYLQERRTLPSKIRRAEIEEILDDVLPQYTYQRFECEGYVVWYNLASLFLDTPDPKSGLTNLDLLSLGRSPLGADGKSMHLHHATLYDAATHKTTSYLILMTNTSHSEIFHDDLHFSPEYYWMPKKPVERRLFDPIRGILLQALSEVLDVPQDNILETLQETASSAHPLANNFVPSPQETPILFPLWERENNSIHPNH